MCFMLNRSPSVVIRLPSSCFAITSAGLTLIFSIRSFWFFSFCCSQKHWVSMCMMAPLRLGRASLRAAAVSVQIRTRASCPNSRTVLANPMASLGQCAMLCSDSAPLSDTTFCVDDKIAEVRCSTRILQMSSVSFSCTQLHLHLRVHELS